MPLIPEAARPIIDPASPAMFWVAGLYVQFFDGVPSIIIPEDLMSFLGIFTASLDMME